MFYFSLCRQNRVFYKPCTFACGIEFVVLAVAAKPGAKSSGTKKAVAKKASTTKKGASGAKGSGIVRAIPKPRASKVKKEPKKAPTVIYTIDCSVPAADSIFDADLLKGFEQFLTERIKVQGKTGKLRDAVKVALEGSSITVKAFVAFSKKYLKFLTKKYLKKKTLRDWLRVVAANKTTYILKYYNIQDKEEEEDDE